MILNDYLNFIGRYGRKNSRSKAAIFLMWLPDLGSNQGPAD